MRGEPTQFGHRFDLCPTCGNHQRTQFRRGEGTILYCPGCGYNEPLDTYTKDYRR